MNYHRPEPTRSYNYNNYKPYGASELFVMDHLVENDFSGNVPDEIMKNGGTWDDENKVMYCGTIPVYFVKMEAKNEENNQR